MHIDIAFDIEAKLKRPHFEGKMPKGTTNFQINLNVGLSAINKFY